ncbi:hypothetical protein [Cardinium endosymbiont of Bemisia tabaci]|uniref:hypothetical protein n=3 Tax=Cardinium endosymbiont of Bemisia tabaci TaxID=672794 RepID=UPI000442CF98|nr:hypothetical protein [Cardinium endosymbiont of Bemisia tabaci]CDG50383.1 Hypothetical protein CHV_p018 [Cardinium endosymbiont cBtQ1 of Bemisia tabaci]
MVFQGRLNNTFNIKNNTYHGKINLGSESTNVIDVRNPSNSTIIIKYLYERGITQMNMTTNSNIAHISAAVPIKNIQYVSDSNRVDEIVCNDSNSTIYDDNISNNSITIDSGGGISYDKKDTIKGCKNLIVSPNTIVEGNNGNYTILIKSKNFDQSYGSSKIDISGIGINRIIFRDISLLNETTKIEYNPLINNLIIYMPSCQNSEGEYELSLENYITHNNGTRYVLIDKHGSNIVPILDNHIKSHDVNRFLLYADIESNFEDQTFINHYKNLTYTAHKYNIFSIVRNKNDDVFKFGSVGHDIIHNDGNTIFMSGGEGSDLYMITQTKKYLDLSIRNHATDLALDILIVPSILTDIILNRNGDHLVLDLLLSNYITILDYFRNKENRHIALIDQNNDIFIPYEIEGEIKLIPFCRNNLSKNIFRFFSTSKHIVIDIDTKYIGLYKQENDLLIKNKTDDNLNGLNIILTDYYENKQEWLDVEFYSYKNGTINPIYLHNMTTSYMSYQNLHDSLIQTYIVDLTNRSNQETTIKSSNEKLGVILFRNTPLKRLVVQVNQRNTFYFQDNLYNSNTLKVNNSTDSTHRILMFEFDNGLEPERIYVSNTNIERIRLNNKLDQKTGGNITIKVIERLMSYCMPSNTTNLFPNQLVYSFLEEELHYRKGYSINRNNDVEERNPKKVLTYLVFKSYNELLLKYTGLKKEHLHKIDDSCFSRFLGNLIKEIKNIVNTSIDLDYITQFIIDNKEFIGNISLTEPLNLDLDIRHKHRHHHGEGDPRLEEKGIIRRSIDDYNLENDQATQPVTNSAHSNMHSSPINYIFNMFGTSFSAFQSINPIGKITDWFSKDTNNINQEPGNIPHNNESSTSTTSIGSEIYAFGNNGLISINYLVQLINHKFSVSHNSTVMRSNTNDKNVQNHIHKLAYSGYAPPDINDETTFIGKGMTNYYSSSINNVDICNNDSLSYTESIQSYGT